MRIYHFVPSDRPVGREAIASVAFSKDVADLKEAQDRLRRSESRLAEAELMARLGSWDWDIENNIWYWSDGLCHILGISPNELGNACKSFLYLVHPEDRQRIVKTFRAVLRGEQPLHDYCRINLVDGAERVILIRAKTTFDVHGKAIRMLGTAQDITEQNRLQAQLVQAQKMEAVATLAGGIAHEFNNALVGITGNIDLLEMHLPDDKNTRNYVASMKASAWRMAGLAHKLLAYARKGKYQPEAISLTKFVGDALPSLRKIMGSSARLECNLARDILRIEADLSQLQMVVSAILSNACEAVDGSGHIQITTKNVEIDEGFAKKHSDLEPGGYACLSVEDNGKGMDQETISRMFEPFYTRKSHGRGLGMAAVHGIIKNHGGWISVESELGKGTTVRIYLPAVEVEPKGVEA